MVISPIKYCHKLIVQDKQVGVTLIEMLIALTIISIALTAVIKATTENIKSEAYLANKTIALLIGERVLNEARVGILKLREGEKLKKKTMTGGKEWTWQASQDETSNHRITKINVEVFANEDEDNSPLISLEGYQYHES